MPVNCIYVSRSVLNMAQIYFNTSGGWFVLFHLFAAKGHHLFAWRRLFSVRLFTWRNFAVKKTKRHHKSEA